MSLKTIQEKLAKKGYDPGPIDGLWGPRTEAALNQVIDAAPSVVKPPQELSGTPWMDIARQEVGQKEIRGGENPRIIEYHSVCSLKAKEDEIPWCSAFVCWCLEKAGKRSTKSAWARSFEDYGEELFSPKKGCVVVFDWEDGTGHVGFVTGWTNTTVTVLGGNQADSVCPATFSRRQVSAWRWPA